MYSHLMAAMFSSTKHKSPVFPRTKNVYMYIMHCSTLWCCWSNFRAAKIGRLWFYWMFYDHFSARSLLAKLGRKDRKTILNQPNMSVTDITNQGLVESHKSCSMFSPIFCICWFFCGENIPIYWSHSCPPPPPPDINYILCVTFITASVT